jgi:hypothetical protein
VGVGGGGAARSDSAAHVFLRKAEVTAESICDGRVTLRKDVLWGKVVLKWYKNCESLR